MLDTAVPTQTTAVRNLSKTNVILSGDTKGSSVEWGYAGIPDGSDIQEVPIHVWASSHMRRAKARGILAEDTMESMDQAFDQQRAHIAREQAERSQEVNAALRAGTGGADIVISEDALTEHMARVAKSQPSDALVTATEAQAAQAAAAMAAADAEEARLAELAATTSAFIPEQNSVAALDGAL